MMVVIIVTMFGRQGQNGLPVVVSAYSTYHFHTRGRKGPISIPSLKADSRTIGVGSVSSTVLAVDPLGGGGRSVRTDEIRRKIRELKKEGKIQDSENSASADYAAKIKNKLGKKSKLMKGGVMDYVDFEEEGSGGGSNTPNDDDEGDGNFYDEEEDGDLLAQVQEKMTQKRAEEAKAEMDARRAKNNGSALEPNIDDIAREMERELEKARQMNVKNTEEPSINDTAGEMERELKKARQTSIENREKDGTVEVTVGQTTSGIGGNWANNVTSQTDSYRPANGGWGYFPRPKDISKAYGGGKRIGAGVSTTKEDEERSKREEDETKARLQRYREKVGIDVASEKENIDEINEALAIAQRAMQRGIYDVAVRSLEKVTQYCSTNSEVGGQVFLELAMAYEAVGRPTEAVRVYTALSFSRIEKIKSDARRLILGIEAMKFMRDEVKAESFQKKVASQTFVDATGLANIANNFDDVYQTAYVDLGKGGNFYRKITEDVVRSLREARQILLKAVESGDVSRPRIVQALRAYSRKFDEALNEEVQMNTIKDEPVAMLNGVPIISEEERRRKPTGGIESFILGTAESMRENLVGEWRLQLLTDRKGDKVSFFDNTVSWQSISLDKNNDEVKEDEASSDDILEYRLSIPVALFTLSQRGRINFDNDQRVISRVAVTTDGFCVGNSAASVATNAKQQIISVDSELLITRLASKANNRKDYFSVWRRVEPGSYSDGGE